MKERTIAGCTRDSKDEKTCNCDVSVGYQDFAECENNTVIKIGKNLYQTKDIQLETLTGSHCIKLLIMMITSFQIVNGLRSVIGLNVQRHVVEGK